MLGGRPVKGLLFRSSRDYMELTRLDTRGNVVVADGQHPQEQDELWAMAARGARTAAARFTAAGNRASAAYYGRLAYKIEHDRPE